MDINKNNKVFIYGCDASFEMCERFLRLQGVNIEAVFDNNSDKTGTSVKGYIVKPSSELNCYRTDYRIVISSSQNYREISDTLEKLGYSEGIEFISFPLYFNQYMGDKKIISLGYNCEVSQRLNDFSLVESFPFSWAYVESRENLLQTIEKPENLLSEGVSLTKSGMFRDNKTGIRLHSHFHKNQIFDEKGNPRDSVTKKAVNELTERVNYLIDKFTALKKYNGKLFFVCKYETDNTKSDEDYYTRLYNTLKHEFVYSKLMLYIVREKDFKYDIEYDVPDGIHIRYVERYADEGHTDTDGDFEGWYSIIRELVFEC